MELNELKGNTNRQLSKIRKTMHEKIENDNKKIEIIRKNQTNFGAEEYINCTEKFIREPQQQT